MVQKIPPWGEGLPYWPLAYILHTKLTYTTAILKELRETIRVTNFKNIQFKKLYIHEMTYIHMSPAQRKTVLELLPLTLSFFFFFHSLRFLR